MWPGGIFLLCDLVTLFSVMFESRVKCSSGDSCVGCMHPFVVVGPRLLQLHWLVVIPQASYLCGSATTVGSILVCGNWPPGVQVVLEGH